MSETWRIEDQLKRSQEGEAWHGPALRELLDGVGAVVAAAKPVAALHSIWEIVLHIAAWEDAARRRMAGDPAPLSDAEDWAPVQDTSEAAWRRTLAALQSGHEALRAAVRKLDDSRLSAHAAGQEYSIWFLLHGVIQHNLYHAGQIALLKRMQQDRMEP